jgi:hypothetical protein
MSIAQRAIGLDFCIIARGKRTREEHFSIYLGVLGYAKVAKTASDTG